MKKGSVGIFILIVVIVLVLAGAIFYFTFTHSANKESDNSAISSNTQTNNPANVETQSAPSNNEVRALQNLCESSCDGFCKGIGETYNGMSSSSSMNMTLCNCNCGNLGNLWFDKDTGKRV